MDESKWLRDPLHRDRWATFYLFGQRAYADSGLALIGAPPSENTEELTRGSSARLERAIAQKSAAMIVTKKTPRAVFFDEIDRPIDVRYYEHVMAVYPAAKFHAPKRRDSLKPITIKSGDQIVGALMCMDVDVYGLLITSEISVKSLD